MVHTNMKNGKEVIGVSKKVYVWHTLIGAEALALSLNRSTAATIYKDGGKSYNSDSQVEGRDQQ
jgi:hypothetical protein